MPNSILWIGLVVLWVFVLFPMLTDRHPRIRQHTDAALSTRVLHRGDAQRRTRKGPATGHDTDPDYVPVRRKHHHSDDPEDRMTRSDESATTASDDEDFDTASETGTDSSTSVAAEYSDAEPGTAAETDIDHEESAAAEEDPAAEDPDFADAAEYDDQVAKSGDHAESAAAVDDDEPVSVRTCSAPEESAPAESGQRTRMPALRAPEPEDDDESDSEDEDFVPSRRGRGGFDPEADAIARAARYTFRQRAVLALILSALMFGGAGVALSARFWWLCGIAGVILVTYLAYLRRQVRIEEDIRRRRIARLSKKRRQAEDDEEAERAAERDRPDREEARTQLRRAVLVEPDDEDPAFEHLELFDAATARAARHRAAGNRARRAVGE
ncbi:hypothetical protein JK358_13455 [Nocardia sp. 2]|uniref:Transmembrane protein n=1 Tax=Nocardia acididurans TaxID=2802282 RepID=A0ABS1M423_9NOCA|nr:gephyrin-like molybdotransferase receptor GlpR [Nocardia acididurans]MBL1075402.1 hypothetical protein [Nocardia acididurans]